jgi:hypothetical protein
VCVCVCVCVCGSVTGCHSRVSAQAEGLREWGAEEYVWALEGSDRRLEKIA